MGTTLAIEAVGADLSSINTLVPTLNLPAESFRVKGGLEILATGIGLRGVDVAVGSATGTLDGRIGSPPDFDGTTFQVQAKGPSLAVADDLIAGVRLPAAEFSLSGSASMRGDAIDLAEVVLGLGGNSLRI